MLPDEKSIDGAAVLRSIEVQHGILVERAEGIYSFSHLTLQEYLTAQYIDDHRQIESLVAEHLTDGRWREIFILVAGLMRGGSDELLRRMEAAAQAFIFSSNLKAILCWAHQATADSFGGFKPCAERAAAIFIGVRLATRADANNSRSGLVVANLAAELAMEIIGNISILTLLHHSYDLATNCDFARKIEEKEIFQSLNFSELIARLEALKHQTPTEDASNEIKLKFAKYIWQAWYESFDFNPDWMHLSTAEMKHSKITSTPTNSWCGVRKRLCGCRRRCGQALRRECLQSRDEG
jgi:hypothetical protein